MKKAVFALAVMLLAPLFVQAAPWSAVELFDAARSGNVARAVELLTAEPDLARQHTPAGETALHAAVGFRQAELVELLLSAGADLNAPDAAGRTPLHVAAMTDAKFVRRMLEAGANVKVADENGETPLHVAARRADAQSIFALIEAGAEPNARNARGQTPLHVLGLAVREPEEVRELVEALAGVLIAAGAEPQILDQDGLPAWPHPKLEEPGRPPSGYPTWAQVEQTLAQRASQYPQLCRLYDLGVSVQGRHIWALNISDNAGTEEDEPEFRWIANMHGDEVTGLMLLMYMIDYLLQNYGTDPRVTSLVDSVDIWIVPSMNPDGYTNNTRYNAHGVDLNRNFPEGTLGEPNSPAGREPETAVIMNWCFGRSFTLSANYHGGSLVVNYPYDNDGMGSVYSPTPDDDLFIYISEEYSRYNLPMWNSSTFYHGITNGAAWYAITGGLQDWSYRYMSDNDVTIEVSTNKAPPFSQIPNYWNDNRESMLAYMETCLIGVRGVVTDAASGAPLSATIWVTGRNHPVYTDPDVGDYHRMLLPGTYELRFEAAGYDVVTVPNVAVASGPATRLDVQMFAAPQVVYPNGGEELYVGRPVTIVWTGNPAAQFQVQQTSNYGQTAQIEDGFERNQLGPDYQTGGNLPWATTMSTAHSGTWSARAGAISHNQQSWMTRTVAGGTVSFWYRVSSEANYDFFNFYVDGNRQLHVSGERNWTLYSTTLSPGSHSLKWEYVKDGSVSYGSDTAWVDDLSIVADQTTWTDIVPLTPPGATSCSWTPGVISDHCKVRIRSYLSGGYGNWDESNATFRVIAAPNQPGDLNCDGLINAFDIDPFVLALSSPAQYEQQYPNCQYMLADINGDGQVNAFDIDPFVELLTGG
jgi:hypothetical protein